MTGNPSRRLTLLLTSMLAVISGPAMAPALPVIAETFASAPESGLRVRLILTLPALFTALGAPLAGLAIDRWGQRRLLIGSTLLFGIAGSLGGMLDTLGPILLTRALVGLSAAGILTTTTTLIADYWEGGERGRVLGQQAASLGLGGVAFPVLVGLLVDVSWRATFAIHLLAFAVLPLILLFLQEPALGRAAESSELGAEDGPLPWRTIAMLYAMAFAVLVIFFMIPVEIPFYLRQLGETSGTKVGLVIAGGSLAAVFTSMGYGFLSRRFGASSLFALLCWSIAAGHFVVSQATHFYGVLVGLLVGGLGFGLLLPHLNTLANAAVSAAVRGRVIGGLMTCLFLGQFFSPIINQPLIGQLGLRTAYIGGAAVMGVIALLFSLSALRIPPLRGQST